MSEKKWLTFFNAVIVIGGIALILLLIPLGQKVLVSSVPAAADPNTNWGLGFGEAGTKPRGNATSEFLKGYDSYFLDPTEEKVIYLTFDAGYENGYTASILDTLKEKGVPAAFFLVGHYFKDQPDLVRRMVEEGHLVGNHTMTHPNMSAIGDLESFKGEIEGVEKLYAEVTGQQMAKYYRPPQGKYSEQNLGNAKELGYKTIFWSLAYVDWVEKDQPSKEYAFSKLLPRTHPGAIVLLHSTSKTNCEILSELIDEWKAMGYTFKSLEQLPA